MRSPAPTPNRPKGHRADRGKTFWTAVVIGVLIEFALVVCHRDPILTGARNWASDVAMRLGVPLSSPTLPLAFIDVDEATWRDPLWGGGSPFFAPRDRLGSLIAYGAAQKPRYMIVDIAVETPRAPEDAELARRLAGLPGDLDVLLVRSLLDPLYDQASEASKALLPRLQDSALDDVIASHPNLHVVSPRFEVSRDGLVRGWVLWALACRADPHSAQGHIAAAPSPQLEIAFLRAGVLPPQEWPGLRCATDLSALGDAANVSRLRGDAATAALEYRRALKRIGVEEDGRGGDEKDETTSRILYRFGARPPAPSILRISAESLLRPPPGGAAAALAARDAKMAGGVVVIGQSSAASGDNHATPLGLMPGSLVILNAVQSFLRPGVIREFPGFIEFLITAAMTVSVAAAFASYPTVRANALLVVAILVIVVPLSGALLHIGIWLDFALPLITIALHRGYAEIEGVFERRSEPPPFPPAIPEAEA